MPHRLKELRVAAGKTQDEIANELGITVRCYRNYELSKQEIKLDTLLMLSDMYGVSTDYILGRSDYRHGENANISAVTGLSDEAIEYLRLIKQNPGGLSEHTPRFINYVLEQAYDDYQEKCATATNEEFARLQVRELNKMRSSGESLHDPQTWMKAASLSVREALALNMQNLFDRLYDYVCAPPEAWYADDYSEKHLISRIEPTVYYHDYFGLRTLGSGKAEPLRRDMNLLKLWRTYQIDIVKEQLDEMVKKEEQ